MATWLCGVGAVVVATATPVVAADGCLTFTGVASTVDCSTGQQVESWNALTTCPLPTGWCTTKQSASPDGALETAVSNITYGCANGILEKIEVLDCNADCSTCGNTTRLTQYPSGVVDAAKGACFRVSISTSDAPSWVASNVSVQTIGGNVSTYFRQPFVSPDCNAKPQPQPSSRSGKGKKITWVLIVAVVVGSLALIGIIACILIKVRRRRDGYSGGSFLQDEPRW
eukprot:CAMPEP_0182926766 /NCGR_PEP_ID=MMETSP0105_2-20130417/12254_1 /TAXON_ID=81532 ORGANISM="Acanthoeca-like sp., Strain 10tr" /NCGR_SAMPLE_ID=MMETSP0105_2 /ASSEMBLY_ACC=CAM_ASM_000205 /LENGTH=226 /DNA_ID=CAMNT_0025064675 /DNA_START=22 /DNA_END=702 /DNA_ORIENTATION=-